MPDLLEAALPMALVRQALSTQSGLAATVVKYLMQEPFERIVQTYQQQNCQWLGLLDSQALSNRVEHILFRLLSSPCPIHPCNG